MRSIRPRQDLKIVLMISEHGRRNRRLRPLRRSTTSLHAEDFPDENRDEITNVNVTAGLQFSRELAEYWFRMSLKGYPGHMTQPREQIVFIASMTSFSGSVEILAYTASKGAIAQLRKALKNERMARVST